jgi:hypothetical protein
VAAAHHDRSAPGLLGLLDPGPPVDQAAGGEIGPRDDDPELVGGDLGVLDERDGGVDDLAQVVRRDVGGHADGDAARPVHQQLGELRGQDARLELGVVVVGGEVDGLFVEIGEQLPGEARESGLGVPHGRGRIAVDRAEVPLPVDERVTQAERLRHAHERVVDGLIAVRVVLAEHVADDARAFLVGAAWADLLLAHREEDPAVDRLEPVAHIGDGAADDHAHGVIEVTRPHLVLDADGDLLLDVGGFVHARASGSRALVGREQNGRKTLVPARSPRVDW